MNPRITVGVVGAITTLFGLGGLLRPDWVMRAIGYAVAPTASEAFLHGEIRALYGGLILVAGVFTLLSAADPRAHQGRLILLGLLWLGTCGGRVFGMIVDGSPGAFGWLSAAVELLLGGALLVSSQVSAEKESTVEGVSSFGT
ncbi:MAG: DUF4345 family protein [Candidatus Binatia bacterium]